MDFEERRKHAQEFAAAYPQGASTAPTATTSEAKTWTGGVDAENGVLVLSNETSGRIRALTTAASAISIRHSHNFGADRTVGLA